MPATSCVSCSHQLFSTMKPPEPATVLSSSCASWSSRVWQLAVHVCTLESNSPMHCGTAWCRSESPEYGGNELNHSAYLLSLSALQDA